MISIPYVCQSLWNVVVTLYVIPPSWMLLSEWSPNSPFLSLMPNQKKIFMGLRPFEIGKSHSHSKYTFFGLVWRTRIRKNRYFRDPDLRTSKYFALMLIKSRQHIQMNQICFLGMKNAKLNWTEPRKKFRKFFKKSLQLWFGSGSDPAPDEMKNRIRKKEPDPPHCFGLTWPHTRCWSRHGRASWRPWWWRRPRRAGSSRGWRTETRRSRTPHYCQRRGYSPDPPTGCPESKHYCWSEEDTYGLLHLKEVWRGIIDFWLFLSIRGYDAPENAFGVEYLSKNTEPEKTIPSSQSQIGSTDGKITVRKSFLKILYVTDSGLILDPIFLGRHRYL